MSQMLGQLLTLSHMLTLKHRAGHREWLANTEDIALKMGSSCLQRGPCTLGESLVDVLWTQGLDIPKPRIFSLAVFSQKKQSPSMADAWFSGQEDWKESATGDEF